MGPGIGEVEIVRGGLRGAVFRDKEVIGLAKARFRRYGTGGFSMGRLKTFLLVASFW
jgi:hypothetical protein